MHFWVKNDHFQNFQIEKSDIIKKIVKTEITMTMNTLNNTDNFMIFREELKFNNDKVMFLSALGIFIYCK